MKEQYKGNFITEDDLKYAFDEYYVKRQIKAGKILKYSYEVMRYGGADLVTIEEYDKRFQIRAFEFKLTDWRKALDQAKKNLEFAHQSFIVMPEKQLKNIINSGMDFLLANRSIGIITIDPETKKWKRQKIDGKDTISQDDKDIRISQEILSMVVDDVKL